MTTLECDHNEWGLQNWTEQTLSLLPNSLIKEHFGVQYLQKDAGLTDSLVRTLRNDEYGPNILVEIMTSLCRDGSLKSMGPSWLSSWLNVLYLMTGNGTHSDVISSLSQLPFIPLLDGNYASVNEGSIWLHFNRRDGFKSFGKLYSKLRIVNFSLFNDSPASNITQMLLKVGILRLSAHEVLKVDILPAISDEKFMLENIELMIEYLSYIMFHLESTCPKCPEEKENILSQLRNNAFISTNHGYKRLVDSPIHFSSEFGNPFDMNKLNAGADLKWVELDISYLKHPVCQSSPDGTLKWRKFFQELGVTDFVKIDNVEKRIEDLSDTDLKNMMLDDDCISSGSIVHDYDSQELMHLLSHISSSGDMEKGKYLLEVLDSLWDEYFGDKITGFCIINGQSKPFKASIINILHSFRWLASSVDDQLHFPKDLFHNYKKIRSVLGDNGPYAILKVNSVKLLNNVGCKNAVTLDDALSVLEVWRRSNKPFKASISQMSKLYTLIWNNMSISKHKIMESLQSQDFIFVPYSFGPMHEVVSGLFSSPNKVYWHDFTSLMKQTKSTQPQFDRHIAHHPFSNMLCNIYPGLHEFFVNEFNVAENPPLLNYLQSLLHLSTGSLPTEAAKTVFKVFQQWSIGLDSGVLSSNDIDYLKKSMEKKKMRILPTVQDKWVSMHRSFGLVCWGNDKELQKEFQNLSNVDFLYFGDLSRRETKILQGKISVLFRRLGIPSLSEVVTREAIYSGVIDRHNKTSLVSWVLPYAQRYIYCTYPNEYLKLKLSGFMNLSSLKIVVVEKLFYRNVIKKFGVESNEKWVCSSLLQDNTLYTTCESDARSLFMELFHFQVSGISELSLADFFQVITTMAESGSTEEQIEFFVTNSQRLLKLPSEESLWSVVSMSSSEEDSKPITNSSLALDLNPPKSRAKKFGKNSSGKTAPGFECASKTESSNTSQTTQEVTQGFTDSDGERIIESIRREEFGFHPDILAIEDSILKKQHARLGRAMHCLSQELYSQDSHFLLELVQNADDNVYPCDLEPTLTFILQEAGVIVLNNEEGFSVENIKALCDVGKSTKKEATAGYIGKKGIGFKSVFQVTDAPEIHSNGFHIKFDISDSHIGFVLPTVIPPCDVHLFSKLVSMDTDPTDEKHWNTCIVLPFRSMKNAVFSAENLISMFSVLHPFLLLFLHRLECIKFRNLLHDSLIVMRKEAVGNGIINVFLGKEKTTWFVRTRKLPGDHIRHDVKTTEISVALMLEDSDNGNYIPKLDHQPVFSFIPLRSYGLKFIIQADFILPSSREEIDIDSPWNQWLLSEFPDLFVSAERSFCSLPCFKENPAKGISVFMSYVPLGGEVHGFFSCLHRLIITKLRMSNCLLLEGDNNEWVPPCKVLRNWTEQTRSLLPDSLIWEHLGVGYLNKDTVLTDSLAWALRIEECGPKFLLEIMTSLCRAGSLKSMGLGWLSSWLNVFYLMTLNGTHSEVISSLVKLPFIPLLDGNYASVNEGTIWLHTDPGHGLESFEKLYTKLRVVNPFLFNDFPVENITQMLYKVGVQRLSAHEVLNVDILPAISDETVVFENTELMIEYLSFIMFHLESTCLKCLVDKENILSQLRNNAFISTNHGYKRLADLPIHFSTEFGNPVDMNKLIGGTDMKWFELDISYLKHPVYLSSPEGTLKWRKFFQELGVTDFVKIDNVEKRIEDISDTDLKNMMLDDDCISSGSIVNDYDSQELMHLLSHISLSGDMEKGKYLLEVLDSLWDEYFEDKITGFCSINGQYQPLKASVIRILQSVRWLASSADDELHFPKDLFHNIRKVRAVLGDNAPYAIPKVTNVKLVDNIGLKKAVTLDDALTVLEVWCRSEKPFRASISQMSKLYTLISKNMSISKQKIMESLHCQDFIFVPYSFSSMHEVVYGLFLSPNEVYWHDSTTSMKQTKSAQQHIAHRKMLCNVYPGLHSFFVIEFNVVENPNLRSYLQSLRHLSTGSLPKQAAKTVFKVFQQWSEGLYSGVLSSDDIDYLKKSMEEKEMTILPTVHNKWVSLHESFGLVCWCNDKKLKKEFKNVNNLDFLCLGDLNTEEKQMLQDKISVLFRRLGIASFSEVVTREVIYNGPTDGSFTTSLVSWALPYAQRYVYSFHPNEYAELKLSGFKNLNSLRIVEVEKLSYKNVIKKLRIASDNRCECSCLLEDNILYVTHRYDSHSLFLELSRFLIAGISELHLANFLHMITTMAKSGFTEGKMECFITNSQKLLKLPSEESRWSVLSMSSLKEDTDIPTTSSGLPLNDSNSPKSMAKKLGKNSSWPPVHWKTTQGFNTAQNKHFGTKKSIENGGDLIIEESPALTTTLMISEEDEALNDELNSEIYFDSSDGFKDHSDFGLNVSPSNFITGRTGELVAFNYFSAELGDKSVKWVNEVKESGLPYDILVEDNDNSIEFIEVKATKNAIKDSFEISLKEWQFATEKGESYTIARVVLSDGKLAQIATYKNPVKLCQLRQLQLAIQSSKKSKMH